MVTIKTKNLELTDALRIFINKKIGGLQKFIKVFEGKAIEKGKKLTELFIEVEKETRHHRKGNIFRAEIIIFLPGRKLVAKTQGSDFGKTVIEAREALKREIKKYKFKTTQLARRKQKKMKYLSKS